MTDRRQYARRPARPAARGRGGWLSVPDHRYAAMKWALLIALAVYAALIMGANSARDVDFSAIANRVAAATGVDALEAMDENAFQDRLDATPEGCEGWLLYGSNDVMNVSELMIAKAGEQTLDRLEEAALARVEAQLDVFRSYGVEQKQLLEGATVLRRGDYLFYAVGEQAADWEDAFLSAIR